MNDTTAQDSPVHDTSINHIDPADDRTEADITAQARVLLRDTNPPGERWPDAVLELLFSMALTWCHIPRTVEYQEGDANKLLRRILFDAREMDAAHSPKRPKREGAAS